MNEVDLIPEDYRKQRLYIGWLKRAGLSLTIIIGVVLVGFFYFKQVNESLAADIQQLKMQRSIATENGQQLKQLSSQKNDLLQQLKLLAGLRGGASAEQMFLTMDNALSGPQVWLTNWRFRRAGNRVEEDVETVNTGYFIVVPRGRGNQKSEAWKIETWMIVQGQALDHVAMSEFVANLTRQPEIENVRIVSTRLNPSGKIKLVDFSLEITVAADTGSV